jgi:hypothetical protein
MAISSVRHASLRPLITVINPENQTASPPKMKLGPDEQAIMDFLQARVFQPILTSPTASERLKQGCRLTITRLEQRNAAMMVHYFWSAVVGTERSTSFAAQMRQEGFDRFEEVIPEFRARFEKPKAIRPSR